MDNFTIVLGFLFSLILIKAFCSLATTGKSKRHPPGPAPLPIIGNLHKLGELPHHSLTQLAKRYGPIISLKLGQITTVVISSSSIAKEVLQKQDIHFSSRFIPNAVEGDSHHLNSVVWLPASPKWRSLRKILNSNIFSSSRLDANVHLRVKKIQELVEYCKRRSLSGEAVDIGQAGFNTLLNLLSNTIFSRDLNDPYLDSDKEIKNLIWNIMVEAGKPNLADFFPILKPIDPQGIRRRVNNYHEKLGKLFDGFIIERVEMRKMSKNTGHDDVLDVCLNVCEENPEELDRTHSLQLFIDLFSAGTDTTSSTLEWAMTELLRSPTTMAKAKEELEQVIGSKKIVKEADLSRLPYLGCIIKETMRIHPSVPFIHRKVESDVEVSGYTVPKGAQVLVNAWAIGRDPILWEDPLKFKPERFLNSEIDVRGQHFELIPFGSGRRICPGIPLAMRMLPVMLGSLINNFNWKLDGGIRENELDVKEKFGITLAKADPLRVIPMPLTV